MAPGRGLQNCLDDTFVDHVIHSVLDLLTKCERYGTHTIDVVWLYVRLQHNVKGQSVHGLQTLAVDKICKLRDRLFLDAREIQHSWTGSIVEHPLRPLWW